MDETVARARAKWPDVPDVYGWLALDRRGQWLLREEPAAGVHSRSNARGLTSGFPEGFSRIANAALREFIGRNYDADGRGRWYFQNGPQRVYVRLACTPLILHFEDGSPDSPLLDHCGRPSVPQSAWLDDEGSLILQTARGPGLLDDRDLFRVADALAEGALRIQGRALKTGRLSGSDLADRFGYVSDPGPD
jgi:hypothetical protein